VGVVKDPIKTTVTGMETFKKELDSAQAGDNSGLLLRGVKREDVKRGMVIAKPGTMKPVAKFLCSMYVLSKEEGGRHTGFGANYRPQMFIRTADVAINLTFPPGTPDVDGKMVLPGDNVEMVCELHHPMAVEPGVRFNIREGGRTVATGLVTQVL